MELQTPFFETHQETYHIDLTLLDFGEAYDQVLWDVVWWALNKLDLEEWLIKILQSVYRNQGIRVSPCATPPLPLHIF